MVKKGRSEARTPTVDPKRGSSTAEVLLDAAAAEFATRGYEGTKIQHIVKRAGLTTGALYRQFKNKEELLRAAVVSRAATRQLDQFDPKKHPKVADYLIEAGHMDFEVTQHLGMVLEAFVAARRIKEVSAAIRESNALWVESVRPLIEWGVKDSSIDKDLDPEAVAIFLRILGLGRILYRASGLPQPPEKAWNQLLKRLVQALSVPDNKSS